MKAIDIIERAIIATENMLAEVSKKKVEKNKQGIPAAWEVEQIHKLQKEREWLQTLLASLKEP